MRLANYDLDEDEYVPRGTLTKQYPKGKYSSWVEIDRGFRIPSHNVLSKLESSIYSVRIHRDQIAIKQEKLYSDELYELKDSISELLCFDYEQFIAAKPKYEQLKLSHRRGVLLYGPQGSGKTSSAQRVIQHALQHNGLAFQLDVNPELFIAGLKMVRSVEPDRPIVCLMEDLDSIVEKYGEPSILSYLDGESQIDGVFNIASSNFPEKLERRLVNRPRRFDRVIRVDKPSNDVRREYLYKKLSLLGDVDPNKVDQIVEATQNLSFAALTEIIISTEIMNIPLDDAITIIKKLEKNKPSSAEDKGKMGFSDE